MNNTRQTNRRQFLRKSLSAAVAVAAPAVIPRHVLGMAAAPGANEQIVLAIAGMGMRGCQLVKNIPAAGRIVAICDANARKTAAALRRASPPVGRSMTTTAACLSGRILRPFSWPPATTTTCRPAVWPARLGWMSTSRNPFRSTWPRGGSWSKRHGSTSGSYRSVPTSGVWKSTASLASWSATEASARCSRPRASITRVRRPTWRPGFPKNRCRRA